MKILFLEDSETDVKLIQRTLEKEGISFESKTVERKEEFEHALVHFAPEVILADHNLPSFDSLEALQLVRKHFGNLPFILVTGTVSEEFAVECIKNGADDYILKNKLSRLPIAIQQAIEKRKMEREKERIAAELQQSNNDLRTFIYSATHNLRGPLTTIIGLTKLASAGKNGGERNQDYIRMIDESAHSLDDILRELISVMSIKDAKVSAAQVSFSNILKTILQELEERYKYARERIAFTDTTDTSFFSDERIVTAIIRNTLSYILTHQKAEPVQQSITGKVTTNTTGVRLEIAAYNLTLNGEATDKAFEMFYKSNAEIEETGLSLYLVKNAVEKLHGMVSVDTDKTDLTQFIIELPSLH